MIRVIIERHCRTGMEVELTRQLMELRMLALKQHGYISGETLRSSHDPAMWLTISTWVNGDLWNDWETLPERCRIAGKIEPLLIAPEKVSLFNFALLGGGVSAHIVDQ